jgi:aminomethyltransferase
VRTTPLTGLHETLGARLTDFHGWEMPLSFAGVRAEHEAVRTAAGLFDLCHMGRLRLTGPDVVPLLAAATPSDLSGLAQGACRYTVLLDGEGGIVDDVIAARVGPEVFDLCVNAARREADRDHLLAHANGRRARVEDRSDATAQIGVQGPDTPRVVAQLLSGPFPPFMHVARGEWRGVPVGVSRTGYTGELGVELFLPAEAAPGLWDALLAHAAPCGLGARDTLRLEMGYPLYGAELSEAVDPVEAGLGWVVDWERDDLPGDHRLRSERKTPRRRLTGVVLEGPGVPRAGCPVTAQGRKVGELTSGNMGLTVGHGIGLAYLPAPLAAPDTAVTVDVRGREIPARVARPPFHRRGTVRDAVGRAEAG